MNVVALAECCEFIKDGTHNTPEKVSRGVPVLSAGNVYGGELSFETDRFATEEELAIFRKRLHPKVGDILLTIVGTIGRTAVLTEDKPLIFQRSVCVLRPNFDLLDSLYFRYALESEFVQKQFEKEQQGVAQMGIYLETLNEIQIPLPPLPEQKRIAFLLRRAHHLRHLRRTAHDLGDALLQSVFLEMFGNVKTNDKKWELAKFEDVCESRLGKMLDEKKQTGKHRRPYLRNFNVQWFRLDLSDVAEMDFDEKDRKEFQLQYGDVLICEGGEVGRATIWRNEMPECYFQKALHRARPNPKLANPEYIVHLLWWMAQTGGLGDFTSQVTIAHLTGEKLKELVIPVPPVSLQEEFAGVVARVEGLRARMSEAGRQVEELFESLLDQSFGRNQ